MQLLENSLLSHSDHVCTKQFCCQSYEASFVDAQGASLKCEYSRKFGDAPRIL